MTRLILLNGPPACGKSTIARLFVERHPLALTLDIDRIRDLIGGWRDQAGPAGLLARDIALAAARTHLTSGYDVVVPQLLARPQFIERAEALAAELGCPFHEVVLMDGRENALRRCAVRDGEVPAEIGAFYDRLVALMATRPAVRFVHSREGEIEQTYQDFLAVLGGGLP
ncbi:AAA family ATPase [Actinoplanes derwentensis]|uniref:Predicted kinase n=1 Tax=Actinoplanes derwentensis TaxID=113562 RepID=A0A1H1UZK8_9ACTN|nr:AAA family ATPase [Actinoplanes derwentensis]GID89811.1 hypothetical protein Ade03nite_87350 [Actinoplanes derwentensis]SDS77895.1 Predicted kinase [Actinoplanes derwentensis]